MPDLPVLSGDSILSAICFALGYNCFLIIMWEKGVLDVFKYCYDHHSYENDPPSLFILHHNFKWEFGCGN